MALKEPDAAPAARSRDLVARILELLGQLADRRYNAESAGQHGRPNQTRSGPEPQSQHLKRQRAELDATVREAFEIILERRAEMQSSVNQVDARLIRLKSRIASLSGLERQIGKHLSILLGSRRWRVGEMVFAAANRILMRSTRNPIPDRFSKALADRSARRRARQGFATHLVRSVDETLESISYQSPSSGLPEASSRGGDEQSAARLIKHSLPVILNTRELEDLENHIERLASIGEALLSSRRWRFGAWLASTPHRLLLRPPPSTVAATLSGRIRNYRIDKASLTRVVPRNREVDPMETFAAATLVDIVVCVHNALDDVQRCLHSIAAKSTVDFRLFVVNDGSDEETTRWLRRFTTHGPNVNVIETGGPLGYTRAANRGLRASTADFVVLLNSDTIVGRLWLEALLECITSDGNSGIAGPVSNAATWQSIPETFNEQGGWAVNRLPPGYNVDEFSELVRLVSQRAYPRVDLVNGFCLMIRRNLIERIGYLDEASFPRGYGEENDYCLRARDAGFELAIADHCYVYHAKSKSFGSATRDRLAALGTKTLEEKYGSDRLLTCTERLRNSPILANLRRAVSTRLVTSCAGEPADTTGEHVQRRPPDAGSVLFVLPVRGGSGGANSVIQEVAGMRELGVEARAATHVTYRDRFRHFYREYYDAGNHFLFFDSDTDLLALSEPFDIIVATLWSTPAQIEPIARNSPDKIFVYYVQDYEPWFFPHDPNARSEAAGSYTLLPEMALMAKTDWICRTVRERHGREVYRVAPSLDHGLYFAESRQRGKAEGITIAAMIRPATPRRAPIRTLRVLRDAARHAGPRARAVIFGCEPAALRAHLKQHAPELHLDFPIENRGLLTRSQVAELLRKADIFLDLSDYQAFGRTGLEAMACGCATVLTANGGSYEYALDGENCLMVDVSSTEEISAAVNRLIDDFTLRRRIQSKAIETAARYSIRRASLSELSVFRLVSSLRRRKRKVTATSYRRGVGPVVAEPAPVSLSLLAPSGAKAVRPPISGMEARILRPLRHAKLRNRFLVRESDSPTSLREQRPDICVVATESIQEPSMARQIVTLCREANIKLIYETDERPDIRADKEAAVRLVARAADRVIVSSGSLRKAYAELNSAVKVLPAAIDEVLWMESSIAGERLLGERRSPNAVRLVSLSNRTGLAQVAKCWSEIPEAAPQTISLQVFGGVDAFPGTRWEIMPELKGDIEDSVSRLRAANCWDIALLPVDENTPDADLQFLGCAALGLTILCSDQGSHMRFVRHQENAIVVGRSPSDWHAAITRSIDDADARAALSAQALYDVDTRHCLKRRALEFHQAYCEGLM